MLKYFRVRTEEEVATPNGKIVHKRTEVMLAKDSGAILADLLNRFGEHLLSMDATEIDEKKVKRNTKVYVIV